MNERIKELAIKAGGGPSKWYTDPDVLEYFAELIVKECTDLVDGYYYKPTEVADLIRKHFGVE